MPYRLTSTENVDNAVLNEDNAINDPLIKFIVIVLNGMCRIIHPVFQIKLYYLSKL